VRSLRFLLEPRTRYLFCWFIASAVAGSVGYTAWTCWDEAERGDGNWGHCSIDFGGQWVMGRMIVEGYGRHLYERNYLRMVVERAFPHGVENPKADKSDAENLLVWMVGSDDAEAPRILASCLTPLAAPDALAVVALLTAGQQEWTEEHLNHVVSPHRGGALYPPVHAMYFAPLASLPPQRSYRLVQLLTLLLTCLAGWVVERLSAGRIWWPIAFALLLLSPGYAGTINLGQNSMLSLTLLLLGWWQLACRRPIVAGVCWGLLAFKPVWAMSFLLAPLLTRRWKMAAGMVLTGAAQIGLTLPLVGWRTWLDWVEVGQIASADYVLQQNWVFLSRDLLGIPRRWLLTFEDRLAVNPERLLPTVLGWTAWGLVLGVTVLLAWRHRRRVSALTGPGPAFVLLGCFFSCYHFMYYDVLLAFLPACLLFTEPRQYLHAVFWPRSIRAVPAEILPYYQPTWTTLWPPPPVPLWPDILRLRWVRAPLPPLLVPLIMLMPSIGYLYDPTYFYPPMDTFGLLLLWAWCGLQVRKDREDASEPRTDGPPLALEYSSSTEQFTELETDVRRPHERLADQYGLDPGRL
jgi:arabinofuranan 3-O-arabinosyltransferase